MSGGILLDMGWHVFTRELCFATSMVELTVDDRKGTVFVQVLLEVLPLDGMWCAVVGTGKRVAFALWPVVAGHIMKCGLVLLAVVAAVRSLKTLLSLMVG